MKEGTPFGIPRPCSTRPLFALLIPAFFTDGQFFAAIGYFIEKFDSGRLADRASPSIVGRMCRERLTAVLFPWH